MNTVQSIHEDDSSYPGPERQLILHLQHLEEELQFLEECYPDWFCADYKREIEATNDECIFHTLENTIWIYERIIANLCDFKSAGDNKKKIHQLKKSIASSLSSAVNSGLRFPQTSQATRFPVFWHALHRFW